MILFQNLKVGDEFRLSKSARTYTKIKPAQLSVKEKQYNASYRHRKATLYTFVADGRIVRPVH